ncbi:MAG: methyltransferase domain-containing protein [Balneolaceae bacterium]|nr:methyltransferase domain-containing protein [Balneolaceae bacterium]
MKFLLQFFKDYKQTGAIAPSSRYLARGMVGELQNRTRTGDASPLNILELGAGTGPMTAEILRNMRPADHLDVVEINRPFCEHILRTYGKDDLCLHNCDVREFEPERSYDFIISSLPYENMPVEVGREIWNKKLALCAEGGCIVYFKYIKPSSFGNDYEKKIVERHLYHRRTVLMNLPPARVYTLRVDEGES